MSFMGGCTCGGYHIEHGKRVSAVFQWFGTDFWLRPVWGSKAQIRCWNDGCIVAAKGYGMAWYGMAQCLSGIDTVYFQF